MSEVQKGAPAAAAEMQPAQLAKAALRRLAQEKLEPTPDNYARAYQQEQGGHAGSALPERAQRLLERLASRALEGDAAAELTGAALEGRWEHAERTLDRPDDGGERLAALIDRMLRGVERGGRQWTTARKKDSVQRVLGGSRSDARRLMQRLTQLVASWDSDTLDEAAGGEAEPADVAPDAVLPSVSTAVAGLAPTASTADWNRVVGSLDKTVQRALPSREITSRTLAEAIADATQRVQATGATPELAQELEQLCERADWVLQHRHHLLDQLGELCHELTASLSDLAEDDSWARGQSEAMRLKLEEGLTARGVKSVGELLRSTRARQAGLRIERDAARNALKSLINRMLSELGELGHQTGRFHDNVGRYAEVIENADSLESLAGVVREMVEESRTVQSLVSQTQQRLLDEHTKASDLTQRVAVLEGELRRLSDEVSTDQLTQIANRRGLLLAFEAERSRSQRASDAESAANGLANGLAIGLLDIDNFKRLNDELGHGAGDVALKSLAQRVSETLRPTDLVARYGGEEFVVLLPDTDVEEGQQILTRLQRSLTNGLFMHEEKQIFVTFSAGITRYRDGEKLEEALERADQALYQAKRTGKNRTCLA